MKLLPSASLLLGVSGLVFACSGSTLSTTGGGGSAADAQSFIAQFCDVFKPCCAGAGKPSDGATCRALAASQTTKLQYNASKGNACLQELKARGSTSTFCANPEPELASCDGAFGPAAGAKAPGESCATSDECAPSSDGSARCAYGGAGKRFCQVNVDGVEGSTPCTSTRDGSSSSSTVTPLPDGGPPVEPSRGYVCDVATGVFCGASGACERIKDVGGDCPSYGNEGCVKTAFCNGAARKCEARIAIGGSCAANSEACAAGAHCDPTTRACVGNLALGAACKTSSECEPARCSGGVCRTNSDEYLTQICGK